MDVRIGLVTFGHKYFKLPYKELQDIVLSEIEKYPVDVKVFDKIPITVKETIEAANYFRREDVDAILLYLADWPSEEFPVVFARELIEYPFIIFASYKQESEGSFVPFAGITSTTGNYMRVGKETFFPILGSLNDKPTFDKIYGLSKAAATVKSLRRSTIGMFGGINLSQLDTGYSEFHVRQIVPGILHFDNTELLSRFEKADEERAREVAKDVIGRVGTLEVEEEQVVRAAKVYLAIKEMAEEYELDAVTIREWGTEREINERIITIELAASLLMDEGVVVIPECDIATTITSLAVYKLTGKPMFFGELAYADLERNLIPLIHTGHPSLKIVEDPKKMKITPAVVEVQDFLDKKEGFSLEGGLMPGRITLAKITGRPIKDRLKMIITTGEVVSGENPFPGQGFTYAWIKPDCKAIDLLDTLMREGFAHHVIIGYGDIREEFEALGKILNLEQIII